MDYIQLRLDCSPASEDITDLLAAFLADEGYESFLPDQDGLTAFIQADSFSQDAVDNIISEFPIETSIASDHTFVKGQNWNEEWEKHYFQPIVIADKCVVHSSFHKDVPAATFDILIDPKMAFGTGHHATTSQMMQYILGIESMHDKDVIDMGTGTGILSILCKMRGARDVTGIEIDPGAYENAVENGKLNSTDIHFICGDASALESLPEADIFLANINRNVITGDIDKYAARIKNGGTLLLSGFYTSDIPMIEEACAPYGLRIVETSEEGDHWAAVRLIKS